LDAGWYGWGIRHQCQRLSCGSFEEQFCMGLGWRPVADAGLPPFVIKADPYHALARRENVSYPRHQGNRVKECVTTG
jgi:hypothetical protein